MKPFESWIRALALCASTAALSACGGGGGGGGTTEPPPPVTYTIGGTVTVSPGGTALGSGLVLQNNGGNNLSITAAGAFTFSSPVNSGAAYAVTVQTQPANQTCTVTSGSGTATAAVTNVVVTCSPNTVTVGGTVSMTGGATLASDLVLLNNGANNLSVAAAGAFTFANSINQGAAYAVTVGTQPTGQTCTVTNGSGTATTTSNITNVAVSCAANGGGGTYTVSAQVSGLSGGTLVLRNNGGNDLSVTANGTAAFSTAVASGGAYAVTVATQPAGQTCTVTNGSGTSSVNVTVPVSCQASTTSSATISGGISGNSSAGLVLRLTQNGTAVQSTAALAANTSSFAFSTALSTGDTWSVTVATQPPNPKQTCTVTNGSGTIASSSVSSVLVSCTTDAFTIGGTITMTSGTLASGLVLRNGLADELTVPAGATQFQFQATQASPTTYSVSIKTQPAGQTCTLTEALGIVPGANVSNVAVTCVNSRTPTALNGTYAVSAGGTTLRSFITYFSDGTFIYGSHQADPSCNPNGNSGNGLEYGVYSFNAATGVLTWVSTAVDTTADCGLHRTSNNVATNGTGFAKDPNTGVITGTLSDAGTLIPVTLTPVASTSGQLLGAWTGNGLGFIVYNSDGTAFTVNTQALQNVPGALVPGMEDACLTGVVPTAASGTYLANFTASCSIPGVTASPAAADTNGTAGLSAGASVTYTVNGNTLTTTLGSTAPVTSTRILVN